MAFFGQKAVRGEGGYRGEKSVNQALKEKSESKPKVKKGYLRMKCGKMVWRGLQTVQVAYHTTPRGAFAVLCSMQPAQLSTAIWLKGIIR